MFSGRPRIRSFEKLQQALAEWDEANFNDDLFSASLTNIVKELACLPKLNPELQTEEGE